ncbi:SH3 domain-containing protein [Haloechinothrix alba]|uniref:SH3 domain-containing protein n=2 Tax=Haloechinothrix alba TaxID=664784 RepID=A0A238Z006_9PSEU|nr:M23 family metallopeptidase [Haloechinothrix alba]SNR76700.1 SH3 domain-containing protein [Haloechinothrix alba]
MTATSTGTRWSLGAAVIVLLAVIATTATPLPTGQASGDVAGERLPPNHTPVPEGDNHAFVWPTSGWVAANDTYVGGAHHSGTADIAAPHHTPVHPARSGRVISTGWSEVSGWYVGIEHTGVGQYSYQTFYAHFLEEPRVSKGDIVSATVGGGTVLGHVSRTGNANFSGPHVHFSITRIDKATGERELLSIPGLTVGSWATSGEHIPGIYRGLTPIPLEPARDFDVRVTESGGLGMYETTRRSGSGYVGTIPEDAVVTVSGNDRGQYRVRHEGRTGWVAHSGTRPAGSGATGVQTTPHYSTVNVRRSPGGPVIGAVPGGRLLTRFGTNESGQWNRVQWHCTSETNRSGLTADRARETGGCPGLNTPQVVKYGWVSTGVSYPTSSFRARTRTDDVPVYGDIVDEQSRPNTDVRLGSLDIRTEVTVTASRNGWYRIDYDGTRGWIRGWHTAGRQ